MNSLKNLKLLSISLFTMCLMSFSAISEGAHCHDQVKCPSKKDLILRTDGIQQSIDLIGTFALKFSAAVRETDTNQQEVLVHALVENLTAPFSITINDPFTSTTYTATDYATLLTLIQSISADSSFSAILNGNFSVESYKKNCKGLRTLHIQDLQYSVLTDNEDVSTLISALDQYTIVESPCDHFLIQTIVTDIIGKTPMCCPAPVTPPAPL